MKTVQSKAIVLLFLTTAITAVICWVTDPSNSSIVQAAGGDPCDPGLPGDLFVTSEGFQGELGITKRYDGQTGVFLNDFAFSDSQSGNGKEQSALHFGGPDDALLVGHRDGNDWSFLGNSGAQRFHGECGDFEDIIYGTDKGWQWAAIWAPNGNVYVGNQATDDIREYDRQSGQFVRILARVKDPADMKIGPNGNLYVCMYGVDYDGGVTELNSISGAFVSRWYLPEDTRANDIAFLPDGRILVTANQDSSPEAPGIQKVYVFDENHEWIGEFSNADWRQVHGIDISPHDNNVYVIDGVTRQAHVFDPYAIVPPDTIFSYPEINSAFLQPPPLSKTPDLQFKPPPDPTGACCCGESSCTDLSNIECDDVGGTWLGAGSTCGAGNPCRTGACCDVELDPMCTDGVHGWECFGSFAIGKSCAEMPFDPPCGTGACYTSGGECQNALAEDCSGIWLPDEFCDDREEFSYACCSDCLGATGSCLDQHSTFGCDDLDCCLMVCGMPESACCDDGSGWNAECVSVASEVCTPALGACCDGPECTQDAAEQPCGSSNWYPGTLCADAPCWNTSIWGACCEAHCGPTSCIDYVPQSACTIPENWHFKTLCEDLEAPSPCAPPQGVCCVESVDRDIVLAIDVSVSINQNEITDEINGLKACLARDDIIPYDGSNRIAVVVYANGAVATDIDTLLILDSNSIDMIHEELDGLLTDRLLSGSGTDIVGGLTLAHEILNGDGSNDNILLIGDGDAFQFSPPQTTCDALSSPDALPNPMVISTIAIGGDQSGIEALIGCHTPLSGHFGLAETFEDVEDACLDLFSNITSVNCSIETENQCVQAGGNFLSGVTTCDAGTCSDNSCATLQDCADRRAYVCADETTQCTPDADSSCDGHPAECHVVYGTDDKRDDPCTWWACEQGQCVPTDVVFADMVGQFGVCPPDDAADGNDRFGALNCFSNTHPDDDAEPYPCEDDAPTAFNVDAAGQFGSCFPDGVCDGNDAFAALNAFGATSTCVCPLDGPAPEPDTCSPEDCTQTASLSLYAKSTSVEVGEPFTVDVYLNEGFTDLRGYQVHLSAIDDNGNLLVPSDISTDPNDPSYVFVGSQVWEAFNAGIGQAVVGLNGTGVVTEDDAYLATFTYVATAQQASGNVLLQAEFGESNKRSFLFADDITASPNIIESNSILVAVRSGPSK